MALRCIMRRLCHVFRSFDDLTHASEQQQTATSQERMKPAPGLISRFPANAHPARLLKYLQSLKQVLCPAPRGFVSLHACRRSAAGLWSNDQSGATYECGTACGSPPTCSALRAAVD